MDASTAYDTCVDQLGRRQRELRLKVRSPASYLDAMQVALSTYFEHDEDALVELVGFLETAGPATVRLPVHLLDRRQVRVLASYLDHYEDLLRR